VDNSSHPKGLRRHTSPIPKSHKIAAKILAPHGSAGRVAAQVWVQREQTPRLVLPLRPCPAHRDTTGGSPRRVRSAEDVSQWLITEKLISTVPWDDAGPYLRFSVTFNAKNEADERRVTGEIEHRLAGIKFEFEKP